MNKYHLDELLENYAKKSAPPLPGSFSQNVLREIRLRKAAQQESPGWLSEIYSWVFHPRLLTASLSLAIIVAVLIPSIIPSPSSSQAAHGLGLDVFSSAGIPLSF